MANGRSLHVGLNSVDPAHYTGWSGDLVACEADANDMNAIAESQGYTAKTLLTAEATRKRVADEIGQAAKTLKAGDMFLLSYSGHGGQLPDLNADESDSLDETWCLFDGELVDDEIFSMLKAFSPGVRVLVFSDSCHSGTVIKEMALSAHSGRGPAASGPSHDGTPTYRAMPLAVSQSTYLANRPIYEPILKNPNLKSSAKQIKATAMLISGCQDNQLSADGAFNGRFTGALKEVWNGGKFKGNYRSFQQAIGKRMNTMDQSPELFVVGTPNEDFFAEKPFTI